MANEIMTPKSYLTAYDESAWAVAPNPITYFHIPVFKYDVEMQPRNRQARPFVGLYQAKHNVNDRGHPTGEVVFPLYGWQPPNQTFSLAEYLMTWCFESHEETDLPSKAFEWAQGPDIANVRHSGMRVDSATLRGNVNENFLMLEVNAIGKGEANFATAQTLPNDRNKLVEMEFVDTVITIDGTAISVEAFALNIQHGLEVHFLNSAQPNLVVKTTRNVNLVVVPVKNSDTYSAYRRTFGMTEVEGEIVIRGLHNSTGAAGTQTVGTITLPRLSFVNSQERRGPAQLQFESLQWKALKPDTADNDLTIAWTEE